MADETLIEQVRQYDELYNMANKKYSDNSHKNKLWTKIARQLNTTGPECKARWISLGDQFRKALRKRTPKSGQAAAHLKKWKYEDNMSFIIPFVKERETITNVPTFEISEEESFGEETVILDVNSTIEADDMGTEITCHVPPTHVHKVERSSANMPAPGASKKPKMNQPETSSAILMKYILENNIRDSQTTSKATNSDPIDLFFNAIAATIKTFTPESQCIIKGEIFVMVSKMELAEVKNRRANDRTLEQEDGFSDFTFPKSVSPSTRDT